MRIRISKSEISIMYGARGGSFCFKQRVVVVGKEQGVALAFAKSSISIM